MDSQESCNFHNCKVNECRFNDYITSVDSKLDWSSYNCDTYFNQINACLYDFYMKYSDSNFMHTYEYFLHICKYFNVANCTITDLNTNETYSNIKLLLSNFEQACNYENTKSFDIANIYKAVQYCITNNKCILTIYSLMFMADVIKRYYRCSYQVFPNDSIRQYAYFIKDNHSDINEFNPWTYSNAKNETNCYVKKIQDTRNIVVGQNLAEIKHIAHNELYKTFILYDPCNFAKKPLCESKKEGTTNDSTVNSSIHKMIVNEFYGCHTTAFTNYQLNKPDYLQKLVIYNNKEAYVSDHVELSNESIVVCKKDITKSYKHDFMNDNFADDHDMLSMLVSRQSN